MLLLYLNCKIMLSVFVCFSVCTSHDPKTGNLQTLYNSSFFMLDFYRYTAPSVHWDCTYTANIKITFYLKALHPLRFQARRHQDQFPAEGHQPADSAFTGAAWLLLLLCHGTVQTLCCYCKVTWAGDTLTRPLVEGHSVDSFRELHCLTRLLSFSPCP